MELIDFFKTLLPASGAYALFHTGRRVHVWAGSLDDLVDKAKARESQDSWYYATAAFNDDHRTQANVSAKRCFYFDLDAGAEKYAKHGDAVYPTQQDAIADLVAFAKKTGLMPSLIVSSGGGLHVYYALSEDIHPDEWKPTADALKKFALNQGLRIDPSCTGDSARVLRPLGALHANGNRVELLRNTGKIWSLDEIRAIVPEAVPLPRPSAKYNADINDEILDGGKAPDVSARKIAESCGVMRTISQNRGNVQEPVWRGMLGLVKFSVEGADLAHEWSDGHPSYDFDETQEKFDRYAAKPTTCDFFAQFCGECNSCPHRGQIKSPISLGQLITVQEKVKAGAELETPEEQLVATVPTDALGEDYRIQLYRGKYALAANIAVATENEDGEQGYQKEWHPFTYDIWWLEDWTEAGREQGENCSTNVVLLRNGERCQFGLDTAHVADNKRLLVELSGKSINVINYSSKNKVIMQNYANDQLSRIKAAASRPVLRDRYGFQFDRTGKLICAQGELVIYPDGAIRKALLGRSLGSQRNTLGIACLPESEHEQWGADVWRTHIRPAAAQQVEFYQRYYGHNSMSVAQLAIMLHLASPMLVFAAPNEMVRGQPMPSIGFTVSLYSADSGKGKTAIQIAASSAFGDPNSMVKAGGAGDMTDVAHSARAAAFGNMPLGLDEVTQNNAQQVGVVINRISGGSDKMRGSREGHLARVPLTWALISVVSSNMPQREMLSTFQKSSDALQMRLLELNCDQLPAIGADALNEYEATRNEMLIPNIGALGACINLYCINKGVKRMREIVGNKVEEAARLMGGSNRERFLLKGLACVLAVQEALEQMKLAPFQIGPMVEEYRKALGEAREYSEAVRIGGVGQLRKMMADLSPHFMVTNHETLAGGREDVIENERTMRMPLHGRQVRSGRYTYLAQDAMQKWCQEQGYSFAQLVREATTAGVFMPIEGDKLSVMIPITRGITRIAAKRCQCFKINDVALYGRDASYDNVVDLRTKENSDEPSGTGADILGIPG